MVQVQRLAIDLGTCHTVAVVRRGDDAPRTLLFDGTPMLPSGVYAGPDGRVLVGRDAERMAQVDPGRYEPFPKRRVDEHTVLLGDTEIGVVDLLAAILGRVATEARHAGIDPAAGTVLTCPADWGQPRRSVLLAAATAAGLDPVDLVEEPVAAATYCQAVLNQQVVMGQCLAVFDFGGGTLDVTVVRGEPGGLRVISVGGLDDLGGVDVDAALVGHLGQLVELRDPAVWRRLDRPERPAEQRERRALWAEVRAAKEMLSRAASAPVQVPGLEDALHLTREELDRVAGPLVDRAVDETRRVLQRSGFPLPGGSAAGGVAPPGSLAGIFLVGGSSRIPLVASRLHARTGIAPTVPEQPELPVAYGALLVRPTRPAPPPAGSGSPAFGAGAGSGPGTNAFLGTVTSSGGVPVRPAATSGAAVSGAPISGVPGVATPGAPISGVPGAAIPGAPISGVPTSSVPSSGAPAGGPSSPGGPPPYTPPPYAQPSYAQPGSAFPPPVFAPPGTDPQAPGGELLAQRRRLLRRRGRFAFGVVLTVIAVLVAACGFGGWAVYQGVKKAGASALDAVKDRATGNTGLGGTGSGGAKLKTAASVTLPADRVVAIAVGGDNLYTATAGNDSTEVAAVALADGKQRWKVSIEVESAELALTVLGELLLVDAGQADTHGQKDVRAVLDTKTGAKKWLAVWDSRLDVTYLGTDALVQELVGTSTRMIRVDLLTGATRWARPAVGDMYLIDSRISQPTMLWPDGKATAAPAASTDFDAAFGRPFVVDGAAAVQLSGEAKKLEVVNVADGKTRASATAPLDPEHWTVYNGMIVGARADPENRVTAYRVADAKQAWEYQFAAGARVDRIGPCGQQLICAVGDLSAGGKTLAALDVASGAERWKKSYEFDDDPEWALAGGRLLLGDGPFDSLGEPVIVDPQTGEQQYAFGGRTSSARAVGSNGSKIALTETYLSGTEVGWRVAVVDPTTGKSEGAGEVGLALVDQVAMSAAAVAVLTKDHKVLAFALPGPR